MVLLRTRTDNTGFDPNSSDYALYKNTMFKDCYNTASSAITYSCSAVKASIQSAFVQKNSSALAFINTSTSLPNDSNGNTTIYSWCEVMSCFDDFKVIPSTPRPSAFPPSALEAWNKAGITFLLAFWQVRKSHNALYSDEGTMCKGIEWDTWLIMAWDLGSFIWWCIGLGRFAMMPTHYPIPSMLGWISLWKYCYMIHFHPFQCVIRNSSKKAQISKWTLYTLATLQWIASVYICVYAWRADQDGVSLYPAYTCLASRILDAPGASKCSAEQLCSNEPFFRSWIFKFPHQHIDGHTVQTIFLAGLSVIIFIQLCIIGAFPLIASMVKGGTLRKWRKKISILDFGFAGNLSCEVLACIIVGTLTTFEGFRAFERSRESAVAFYWECNALHVTVSPWRYHFDVNYELPLRVARMWFNS
jgi:hypothetical protein